MACALALMFMTSCTTTMQTISTTAYFSAINEVNQSIESLGYSLTGTSSDQRNEVYVSATSYSTEAGFSSAMNNNYYWYDTYRFTDRDNNTASYQVKYKGSRDDRGIYYVTNVSVVGCDCSDMNDYNTICGYYGKTKKLNNIKKDQVSIFNDDAGSYALGYLLGVIGVGVVAVLLFKEDL